MASIIDVCPATSLADRSAADRYLQAKEGSLYSEKMAWRDVLVEAFGLRDHLFLAKSKGEVVGVLQVYVNRGFLKGHYGVSCALSSSGGGLQGDTPDVLHRLLGVALKLTEELGLDYAVMRLMFPLPEGGSWQLFDEYVTFIMDLEGGPEKVWSNVLRGKTRNQIRKAQREMFTICKGHQYLDSFVKVLHEGVKELGSPCPGRKVFEKAIKRFGKEIDFIVVMDGNMPIAGTVLFYYRRTGSNPWAVSLKRYRSSCTNSLLYWEIVKSCCSRGMDRLDLGRSLVDSGTYHFKGGIGAQKTPLYYYYYLNKIHEVPVVDRESPKMKMASMVWRKTPGFVTRNLGNRLLREVI